MQPSCTYVPKVILLFFIIGVRSQPAYSNLESKVQKLEMEFSTVLSNLAALQVKYASMFKELLSVKQDLNSKAHNRSNSVPLQADPMWSSWTTWSPCSVSCGRGRQHRSRSCSNNQQCPRDGVEIRNCNNIRCWSEWSEWSECSHSCAGGRQHRSRACSKGPGCPQNDVNIRWCNNVTCPDIRPYFEQLKIPEMQLDARKENIFLNNTVGVTALGDGGALVVLHTITYKYQVIRLNARGVIMRTLFMTSHAIPAVIILNKDMLILTKDGTIFKVRLEDGHVYQVHDVKADELISGATVDNDTLILADYSYHEVFTYSLSQLNKQVTVRALSGPTSVSHTVTDKGALYIVCDSRRAVITTYNSFWKLQTTFGGYGSSDGKLIAPQSVIMSPVGTIWVADKDNNRVSEFSLDGQFLRHVLTRQDGIYRPRQLSYSHPSIWVVYEPYHKTFHLKRFKIYRD